MWNSYGLFFLSWSARHECACIRWENFKSISSLSSFVLESSISSVCVSVVGKFNITNNTFRLSIRSVQIIGYPRIYLVPFPSVVLEAIFSRLNEVERVHCWIFIYRRTWSVALECSAGPSKQCECASAWGSEREAIKHYLIYHASGGNYNTQRHPNNLQSWRVSGSGESVEVELPSSLFLLIIQNTQPIWHMRRRLFSFCILY